MKDYCLLSENMPPFELHFIDICSDLYYNGYKLYNSYLLEETYMNHPKGKYAWTVKVGEKGQIVIPKEARDVFDIHPGDTLLVLGDEKQGIAIPPKSMFAKIMQTILYGKNPQETENEP